MENSRQLIKIVLLGGPDVGKTKIMSEYIGKTSEDNSSTIGANYSEKIITKNDTEYEINIWDTAGQEKFHSLGNHFYKDSYIIVLIYNIESYESLEELKKIWYPDVQKYAEKYIILAVVGNERYSYECDSLVDEKEAKKFAEEIGASFHQVSTKSGDGINKLFNDLIDRFLSPEFVKKYKEMTKKNEKVHDLEKEIIFKKRIRDKCDLF